ncbi:glucosaminidase domain-containing protein [Flavobacterium sp.]|uniref:glucosaminidase domain-containing protein n=1 Tax=Flavobacterium sp. TaxID=239 RepID=UPI002B4AE9B1|nr:glucosaminidase domain-containing protein [Flavobacterium sp.]HLP64490.1 glucosaminidase domain-containing protein [Flavobacterium sp.]
MRLLYNSLIKKIAFCLLISFFIACSSSKPVVRTTKEPVNKTRPEIVVRTDKKPVEKPTQPKAEPIVTVPTSTNSQTETLEATSKVKVTTEIVLAYIDKYKDVAQKNMRNHGVPASIALAQAILESGAGTGDLSRQANNHFGIKCHKDWNGPSVKHDDDEAQECFRKYDNVYDSYQDYANFLRGRRWYDPLFKLEQDDYKGWAKGLKKAGYATDPAYPTKLIGLIERYQLQKYDAEVLGKDYVPTTPTNSVTVADKQTEKPQPTTDQHQVVKGDTLYSISKRYNISIEELRKKNNITENAISIGQLLQIK